MANRQVRLDPDVTELVDAQATAWGMSSSSAVVNRLLRQAAPQVDQDRSSRVPASKTTNGAVPTPATTQAPVRRPASRSSARTSTNVEQARVHARALARGSAPPVATAKTSTKPPKCLHPVARRIGDRCADCLKLVIDKV